MDSSVAVMFCRLEILLSKVRKSSIFALMYSTSYELSWLIVKARLGSENESRSDLLQIRSRYTVWVPPELKSFFLSIYLAIDRHITTGAKANPTKIRNYSTVGNALKCKPTKVACISIVMRLAIKVWLLTDDSQRACVIFRTTIVKLRERNV